jgi:hypothetical protein
MVPMARAHLVDTLQRPIAPERAVSVNQARFGGSSVGGECSSRPAMTAIRVSAR